jgi:DNA-binding MarR family transcriptional regulator
MSERLEEIKKELELDRSDISYVVNQDDVKWLINRVEELELETNDWIAEVQKRQKFYEESEESHLETKELLYSTISENKRYKQALEFYADEEAYETKFARKALG